MPSPVSSVFFLASSWRAILELIAKSFGYSQSLKPICFSLSRSTPVSPRWAVLAPCASSPAHLPSSQSALFGL
ncbi:hypothetical protein TSH64_31480 [Azospirillum sp. TSH64]|nr:hypothetical protein TSH64_31480 [Azospirillum sp. TSH64]